MKKYFILFGFGAVSLYGQIQDLGMINVPYQNEKMGGGDGTISSAMRANSHVNSSKKTK